MAHAIHRPVDEIREMDLYDYQGWALYLRELNSSEEGPGNEVDLTEISPEHAQRLFG